MLIRSELLRTTMLAGILGGVYLSSNLAQAADLLPLKAPADVSLPAVDGVNGKVDAFGGSMANRTVYGAKGAVAFPLGGQFGAQIDGVAGSLDDRAFGSIGGHFFWRDPHQALLGLYVGNTYLDQFGGAYVTQVAAEGEYYWQRWTLQGIVGIEFGNSVSGTSQTNLVAVPPGGGFGGPAGVMTNNTFTAGYDIRTRFFDQINLKYYVTDGWDAYVGHRYLGGRNALALGSEYSLPIGHGVLASGFVEGRVGEGDFHGIWGGLRFYFSPTDKPLIARHRQQDPNIWGTDSLFSILNSYFSNGSSTSSLFCNPGDFLDGGECFTPQ